MGDETQGLDRETVTALRRQAVKELEDWFDDVVAIQLREPWAKISAHRTGEGFVRVTNAYGAERGVPVGSMEGVAVLCGKMEAAPCKSRIKATLNIDNAMMEVLLYPENIVMVTRIVKLPEPPRIIQ